MHYVELKHVLPGILYEVQIDASDRGIGGTSFQIHGHGNRGLIYVVSQCLAPTELNYITTEKELLAIV